MVLLWASLGFAQHPNDVLKIKKLKADYLSSLIEEKINYYRKTNQFPSLKVDNKLQLVAKDQAEYNVKSGKADINQNNKKTATLLDRIIFYESTHGIFAENVIKIDMEAKVKVGDETRRRNLKTYGEVADYVVSSWIKDRYMSKNLENKSFYTFGTAITWDKKSKSIFVNQVYGSEPFILPDGVPFVKDDYKIEPYNKSKCNELERSYSYLPELMSDNLYVKDGELFFYFHDLNLLKNILKTNKDGIAIDIISREQFSCDGGNRIYPSKIHSGVMLPPVTKNYLFSKNTLEKEGQLEVSLGPLPGFVDTNTAEFNLLIIQDNCLCNTIIYNSLGGDNLKSLGLSLMFDTLSVSNKADSVNSKLTFVIPFDKNKSDYHHDDIKPFLDSLNLKKYDLKKIDVYAYSSIEGRQKENKQLQIKRAKSIVNAIQKYNVKNVATYISTEENWDGFYESIKGSPYESDFRKLSKEEILQIINGNQLDYNLEPYLADQRNAKVVLHVEKVYMDDELIKVTPERYKLAIKKKDYKAAKLYQSVAIENIKSDKIDPSLIFDTKIPFVKDAVGLNNNIIATRWYYLETTNPDSLNNYLLRDIKTQLIVDPNNPYLLYNKATLELLLWTENYDRIKDPKYLLRDIKALYNLGIENWRISQLILNFHIISADYYYETMQFTQRDRALNEVKKMLLQSKLNRDQTYKVAQYFIFQMRINWTIELMKPWAEKPTIDEEFLFTFLSAAIYNKKLVPEEEYLKFMEKAKKMNPKRFCELFGYPNMSFQLLKDLSVKKMYCESCH